MDKIKILIIAANPWDTKRLGLDEEYREIREILLTSKHRDNFELEYVPAANDKILRQYLLDFEPHIVHFSGHGELQGLFFQNAEGNAQLIHREALGSLFSLFKNTIHCIVLNACYSEEQAEAFAKNIECVIGMNSKVNDKAAIQFSIGFYQALFSGRDIDLAFELGKNTIDLKDLADWEVPQLKKRQAVVLDSKQPPKTFLSNYQYDVLIHAASNELDWAEQFKTELQKYLSQALNNQSFYLHLQTSNAVQLEKSAVSLFINSTDYVNEYQAILSQLIKPSQKQLLINRSEKCPKELSGLSNYPFYGEKLDFSNSACFQELAVILAQHLKKLKEEWEHKKYTNPFSEPLVFIHTEPQQVEIDLAKKLKPFFKAKGLACAIPNLKAYGEDVKLNQKNCHGVLIIYGNDYLWAKQRINEYYNLKKRRKQSLKIVVIHADCSQETKDMDGLDVYDSVPVFPCPPNTVEELINHFEVALK